MKEMQSMKLDEECMLRKRLDQTDEEERARSRRLGGR